MGTPVDREGNFKCEIIEYGLRKSAAPSQSVGVTLKCRLTEMWDSESQQWIPWAEYEQEADGQVWIVGKDGSVHDKSVESLVANAGWDGTIESIVEKTWKPALCQISVVENVYQGQTKYQIGFLNALDSRPGGVSAVSNDEATQLSVQYGASLRAIAGTVRSRQAPKPNGKPAAPPAGKKATTPSPAAAGAPPADGIPF